MHTIKITPNLLFEYQCTSGKFIRLPNWIEKIDSVARIESNRNFFARIRMLYMEPCFRWESASMTSGEYDWTICARWRCGLMSNYSDHLSNCHCRSGPNLALERIYPRQISFHLGRRFILSSSSGDEHRKLDRFYCIVLRWRHAAAETQSRTQLRAPIEWYHKCVSELERLNDDHRASTNFTVQYSKTNVEPGHGRPHIGANGVSWPPGKMDEKIKSENIQKGQFSIFMLYSESKQGRQM